MSKCGSGKSSKGGGGKSRSGGGNEAVIRSKGLKTPSECLVVMRSALRDQKGKDRDVLSDFAPLAKFGRNGLDVQIRMHTGTNLPKDTHRFAKKLAKKQMQNISDQSGYGWDDDEYSEALREPEGRMLFAYEGSARASGEVVYDTPVAFIDFRFNLEGALVGEMGGQPALIVEDLQLTPRVQRKGLGKHLLMLAQLIAKKHNMSSVLVKSFVNNVTARQFMSKLSGFVVAYEWVPEGEPIEIFTKKLAAQAAGPQQKATPTKKIQQASPPTTPTADPAEAETQQRADAPVAATPAALTKKEKELARKKAQKARKKEKQMRESQAQQATPSMEVDTPTDAAPSASPDAPRSPSALGAIAQVFANMPVQPAGDSVSDTQPQQKGGSYDDAAMSAAFRLPSSTTAAAAAPAPQKQETQPQEQLRVLQSFYKRVGVEKSELQLSEMLHKRRSAGGKWWENMCAALKKKYGQSPLELEMDGSSAAAAVSSAAAAVPTFGSLKDGCTPLVAVIDGAIGAGKTTLIELVRQGLVERGHSAVVVKEPVDEWKRVGILQEFYANPKEVAYDFQTYTFVTRVKETIKQVEAHPDATIFLLERSVLTDRYVFMELQRDLVGEVRMAMYEEWWNLWQRLMPIMPSKMVYLKPTLGNCMQRVNARAREGEIVDADADAAKGTAEGGGEEAGEGGVSAAYQRLLCRAHDAFLLGEHTDEFPNMPPRPDPDDVILVDGILADEDFSVPGSVAQERTVSHIVDALLAQPGAEAPVQLTTTAATAATTASLPVGMATGGGPMTFEFSAEEDGDETDTVLEELMDLYLQPAAAANRILLESSRMRVRRCFDRSLVKLRYKEKHGEDPTDEIVQSWMATLKEASSEAVEVRCID